MSPNWVHFRSVRSKWWLKLFDRIITFCHFLQISNIFRLNGTNCQTFAEYYAFNTDLTTIFRSNSSGLRSMSSAKPLVRWRVGSLSCRQSSAAIQPKGSQTQTVLCKKSDRNKAPIPPKHPFSKKSKKLSKSKKICKTVKRKLSVSSGAPKETKKFKKWFDYLKPLFITSPIDLVLIWFFIKFLYNSQNNSILVIFSFDLIFKI